MVTALPLANIIGTLSKYEVMSDGSSGVTGTQAITVRKKLAHTLNEMPGFQIQGNPVGMPPPPLPPSLHIIDLF